MKSIIKYLVIFPILLISFSCDEGTTESPSTGLMVGTWKLTALSGTYIRDVAVPAGTDSTTYSLKVRWPHDTSEGYQADQTLATYSAGDTVLETTSDASALVAAGAVALVGEFKSDDKYTLLGTYPALRIVEASCSTYQTIADIDDDGSYNVSYNADLTGGNLSITPLVGTEQVLPSFSDGVVTFSDTGNTMNIVFLDRDAHDGLIENIGETWVEADNRVTHGVPAAYVDATGGYFTSDDTQPLGTEGYVMSPLLATWGGYYTYNALMFNGCLAQAMGWFGIDATAAQTYCGSTYPGWLADDSGHEFNATDGKLKMEILPVCIPVNETIEFNATFAKQ